MSSVLPQWAVFLFAAVLPGSVGAAPGVQGGASQEVDSEGALAKESSQGATEAAAGAAVRDDAAAGQGLRFKGRLLTIALLEQGERLSVTPQGGSQRETFDSFGFEISSARVGLEYDAPQDWLSAELDLSVAGKPRIRDAFVQVKERPFKVRAGQFKVPTLAIELATRWDLPMVRRGFIHALLQDWLDVGGRRPGVAFGVRGRGDVKSSLTIGAFQGSVLDSVSPGDRETELISDSELKAQGAAARAELDFGAVELGAFYEHRLGSPEVFKTNHYWTAGADLVVDKVRELPGLRIWLDGFAGASWYEHEHKARDASDATFVGGRFIGAYRFMGRVRDEFYVEPYALFGLLDPDLEVTSDFAWEAAVGINVGLWERARVSLQGEINEADRNFPDGYLGGREPDRIAMVLQAGVKF